MNPNDLGTVYDFVKATGEGNVRKMMTGPKMTAAHVSMLLKLVRSQTTADFIKFCETDTFPKLKYSDAEASVKETFWKVACETFIQLGLISNTQAA